MPRQNNTTLRDSNVVAELRREASPACWLECRFGTDGRPFTELGSVCEKDEGRRWPSELARRLPAPQGVLLLLVSSRGEPL